MHAYRAFTLGQGTPNQQEGQSHMDSLLTITYSFEEYHMNEFEFHYLLHYFIYY